MEGRWSTTTDLKEMAGGNTNVVKEKEVLVDFWGKPLSKRQIRDMQKKGPSARGPGGGEAGTRGGGSWGLPCLLGLSLV